MSRFRAVLQSRSCFGFLTSEFTSQQGGGGGELAISGSQIAGVLGMLAHFMALLLTQNLKHEPCEQATLDWFL